MIPLTDADCGVPRSHVRPDRACGAGPCLVHGPQGTASGHPETVFDFGRSLPHDHVETPLATARRPGAVPGVAAYVLAMVLECLPRPDSRLATTRSWKGVTLAGKHCRSSPTGYATLVMPTACPCALRGGSDRQQLLRGPDPGRRLVRQQAIGKHIASSARWSGLHETLYDRTAWQTRTRPPAPGHDEGDSVRAAYTGCNYRQQRQDERVTMAFDPPRVARRRRLRREVSRGSGRHLCRGHGRDSGDRG